MIKPIKRPVCACRKPAHPVLCNYGAGGWCQHFVCRECNVRVPFQPVGPDTRSELAALRAIAPMNDFKSTGRPDVHTRREVHVSGPWADLVEWDEVLKVWTYLSTMTVAEWDAIK